jgi:hypothetical protein
MTCWKVAAGDRQFNPDLGESIGRSSSFSSILNESERFIQCGGVRIQSNGANWMSMTKECRWRSMTCWKAVARHRRFNLDLGESIGRSSSFPSILNEPERFLPHWDESLRRSVLPVCWFRPGVWSSISPRERNWSIGLWKYASNQEDFRQRKSQERQFPSRSGVWWSLAWSESAAK